MFKKFVNLKRCNGKESAYSGFADAYILLISSFLIASGLPLKIV